MSEEIERLQRAYDLALSNATCYSMRDRGWDSAEHERLGRVLHEKHLELENARLRARVAELEAMVESAFREGWLDGHAASEAAFALEPAWTEDAAWAESDAREALEGE